MSDALFERLDGFLGKMRDKQLELLREADEGCAGLIADFPDDPLPLGNALSGVRAQMMQLGERVDEVWSQQIEGLFSSQAPSRTDDARDRKDDGRRDLDETWRRFEAKVNADFYRAMHPRTVEAMGRPVPCPRCAAVLLAGGARRTEAVTCPGCGAVTQVSPEPSVAQYFGGAGHAFGDEAALPLRFVVERDRVRLDRERRARGWAPESVESLDRWVALEQVCWERYAEVRAQTTGDPVDTAFVKSRMDAFRKYGVEMDQRWRKAKGLA